MSASERPSVNTWQEAVIALTDIVRELNSAMAQLSTTSFNGMIETLKIVEELDRRIKKLEEKDAAKIPHILPH